MKAPTTSFDFDIKCFSVITNLIKLLALFQSEKQIHFHLINKGNKGVQQGIKHYKGIQQATQR